MPPSAAARASAAASNVNRLTRGPAPSAAGALAVSPALTSACWAEGLGSSMSGAMCGASTLASSTFRVAAAGFATLGVSIRGVSIVGAPILAASGLDVTPGSGAADFGASDLSASDLVASGLIASDLIVRSADANAVFGEALASASRTGAAASPLDKVCPSEIVSSLPIKCPHHAPGDWKPWALPTGYYLAGGRPTDRSPGLRAVTSTNVVIRLRDTDAGSGERRQAPGRSRPTPPCRARSDNAGRRCGSAPPRSCRSPGSTDPRPSAW